VLGEADGPLGAAGCELVGASELPACVDRDGVGAEPPADLYVCADQAGRDRVAVAPQRHERVGGDGADLDDLGRIRRFGQRQQRLGLGERTDRGVAAPAVVRDREAEPVDACLGLGW
jgi:hypothetical protein